MPVHMQGLSFCGQICTHKFVLLFLFQCKQQPGLHISDAPVPLMLQCLLYRWNLNECNNLISHVADLLWGLACSHMLLHFYPCEALIRHYTSHSSPSLWPDQDGGSTPAGLSQCVLNSAHSTNVGISTLCIRGLPSNCECSKRFFDGSLLTLPQLLHQHQF